MPPWLRDVLPALLPYIAATVILVMAWALACVMYEGVRRGHGSGRVFLDGMMLLAGVTVIAWVVGLVVHSLWLRS